MLKLGAKSERTSWICYPQKLTNAGATLFPQRRIPQRCIGGPGTARTRARSPGAR